MTANNKTPDSGSLAKRRARLLRIISAVVLVLGIFGADLVYWLGTRSADVPDNLAMLGNEKAEARQIGILYGNQGLLVKEWTEGLKRPGTQACIIVLTAALVAGGCFYFARLLEEGRDDAEERERA